MADESFDSIYWSMAMNGSSHDEGELTDDSETWLESSSEEEESSYDEDDPRWVSRTIVDIRPARTIENQRITIGDLQRVLDILRGEELEVRFAAKLGINVTIVTSTHAHHFSTLTTFLTGGRDIWGCSPFVNRRDQGFSLRYAQRCFSDTYFDDCLGVLYTDD